MSLDPAVTAWSQRSVKLLRCCGAREPFQAGGFPGRILRDLISPAASELLEPLGRRAQRTDAAAVRQSHPAVRAALSFQRMHQQLPILRLLARQPYPAGHAYARAKCGARREALLEQGFAIFCWSPANIPNLSRPVTWRTASAALHPTVPSISLEIGPMETEDYRPACAGRGRRPGRLPGNL